jgi:hypothetical protein
MTPCGWLTRPGRRRALAGILCLLVAACAASADRAGAQPPASKEAQGQGRPAVREVQPGEEAAPPAAQQPAVFTRGKGGGLGLVRLAGWWLLVLLWVVTTDRMARDESRLPTFDRIWLPLLAAPFFVLALAAWWVPWVALAYALMAAGWLGPLLAYVKRRDAGAPRERRFLSREQAVAMVAPLLGRVGIRIDQPAGQLLPPIALAAVAPTPDEAKARLDKAQLLPGFEFLREFLQRGVAARTQKLLLELTAAGGGTKWRIDGVWQAARRMIMKRQKFKLLEEWQDAPPLGPEEATALVAAARCLGGLSEEPAKPKEAAAFTLSIDRKQIPCRFVIESAEGRAARLLVEMDWPPPVFKTLAELGLPEALAAKLGETLRLVNGLVVITAPPGQGLTTTFTQVVQSADRLVRDFVLLEDEADPLKEIQNVKPFRWGGKEKVAPVAALEQAMRGYPTAVVVPNLRDKELAAALAARAADILVIVGIQAVDALDAIDRLRALSMPRDALARTLLASTSQRLIRRLCPNCAESFAPPPDLLARLKKTPETLPALKRASAMGCAACCGVGYLGRTAIFELAGGPTVSKGIAAKVDRPTMQKAAARDGMRRLLDAGITLATDGATSLEEVQRVLKQEGTKA